MSWDADDFYDASFAVEKCRRYHAKLRDFYRRVHTGINAANVVAASGTFVSVLGTMPHAAAVFSAIVALASLLDLVFTTDRKAQLHDELCRRFSDLAAEIELLPETQQNLARVKAERIKIEKDEPSAKTLIDIMAHNDTSRARGVAEGELVPLSWSQRTLGYIFTHDMKRLERWNADRPCNGN